MPSSQQQQQPRLAALGLVAAALTLGALLALTPAAGICVCAFTEKERTVQKKALLTEHPALHLSNGLALALSAPRDALTFEREGGHSETPHATRAGGGHR